MMTMTNFFWTVLALDAIAALVLWKIFERGTHGLLVAAYLLVLAIIVVTALAFLLFRSEGLRITALIVFLLPSAPLVFYSAAATFNAVRTDRQFSGSAYFDGPALELAQALVRRDLVEVKRLLPAAGDLNKPHSGGVTLWQFAVIQTLNNDQSLDMLRALLAAGAAPSATPPPIRSCTQPSWVPNSHDSSSKPDPIPTCSITNAGPSGGPP